MPARWNMCDLTVCVAKMYQSVMQSIFLCFISQGPASFIKFANGFPYQAAQAVLAFVD